MNDRSGGATPSRTATVFIGKWTLDILNILKENPQRHGELLNRLAGISQRMLTRNLRNLESGGLIARYVMNSKPLAVEYSLTKRGRAFLVPLRNVCGWAHRQGLELSAAEIQLVGRDSAL